MRGILYIYYKKARPGLWVDGVDRCRVIELDACTAHAQFQFANDRAGQLGGRWQVG